MYGFVGELFKNQTWVQVRTPLFFSKTHKALTHNLILCEDASNQDIGG